MCFNFRACGFYLLWLLNQVKQIIHDNLSNPIYGTWFPQINSPSVRLR